MPRKIFENFNMEESLILLQMSTLTQAKVPESSFM